jgi:hypothetical protein
MAEDITVIRQTGVMAGLGGLILVVSLFVLGLTTYQMLNSSPPINNNRINIIILSLLGIIIGGAILAAALFPPPIKKSD